MALTQEQKNTITEISKNPESVLLDFIKRPYYLNSFKDEFYQDGTSLIDKILSQYFLTEEEKFLDLYKYVIKNSSLTMFDNSGHKPNAISSLFNLKESYDEFHFKMFYTLEVTDLTKVGYYSYLLEKNILGLYDEGYNSLSLTSIEKYKPLLSGYRDLLTTVIKNKDINFFKDFLNKDVPNINYNELDFYKEQGTQAPYKNILYFALENNSEEIASLIIDKFPQLVANESDSKFTNKKTTPILLSINNQFSLANKIISCMDSKVLIKNFNHMNHNSETVLTSLLNENFSEMLKEKVILLLNSNIDSYQKTTLFKSIFESSISYEDKFYLLSSGLEDKITTQYSHTTIFNSFIFSVQKNPSINQNLFDQFINEFKLRELISEDQVFNSVYFTNMEYFKLINNNFLFSKINPLDFVDTYLKNKYRNNGSFTDDSDYIWYKISKLDFSKLSSNGSALNALHSMLVNNNDKYVNLFDEKKLNYLLSKNFQMSSYRKFKDSKDFFEIIDKLNNSGFSFKEDSNHFLKLLSFNAPEKLLDKIIEKNNLSINSLSKEDSFWNYINSQSIFDYCLKNNAVLNNPEHLTSLVYNYEPLPLELYLKNNGDISYLTEKGNILHELCQYQGVFKNEEILTVLDFAPELAIQTNKQNKFPVSYLISDFNKLCKKSNKSSLGHLDKDKLQKHYTVIRSMFQCGLHSDNKLAFKNLESQLLKYNDITDLFPELVPILRAEKLSKKLEVKGIKIKQLKI